MANFTFKELRMDITFTLYLDMRGSLRRKNVDCEHFPNAWENTCGGAASLMFSKVQVAVLDYVSWNSGAHPYPVKGVDGCPSFSIC